MLTFVGLGLYDERSITVRGRDAVASAGRVFAEFYTSALAGTTIGDLETYHGVEIEVRARAEVERDPAPILEAAESGDVAFLTGGDPMVSTTHVDLRLRAHDRGIETRVVHGTSASTAAAGLTGLQNYRFGKATTLPFPRESSSEAVPASVTATILTNRERDLHTLIYLDIEAEREAYLSGDRAADLLAEPLDDPLGVVVARAGSDESAVVAERLTALAGRDFGEPLHLLVIPGPLHEMEAEALVEFGGAPPDLVRPD